MSKLQIHILAGQQAGARLQLNQSPVTFGRSAECTLIFDLPVVSRLHGELQLDKDGQWLLINHSSNGTRVGRKKATKKPIPLTDGAEVIIGDHEVFRVHLGAEPVDQPAEIDDVHEQAASQETHAPGSGIKGRSKLWIGLGVWFVLCIGAMIFFATLRSGDKGNTFSATDEFYYPGREIEGLVGDEAGIRAIRQLLAEPLPFEDPNASRYATHVDRADQAAEQGLLGLYGAYKQYQLAMSYSDNRQQPLKEPRHVQRYDRILNELSVIIYERYLYAYRVYHDNDYQQARDVLDRLRMEYYNNDDAEDPLANHIKKLRNAAHRRAG